MGKIFRVSLIMNIFSPYIVLEDSQSKLHLKKSSLRTNLMVFVLRFFPFVYLLIAIFLIIYKGDTYPAIVSVIMLAALVIPAIFMFTRKFILEVTITKMGIDVIYNAFFKKQSISYPVNFIDHIYGRKRGGKAPAYIYYAVTKTHNKKERIFNIPAV